MSNTINLRIYDFLKNFPPFSFIDKENLLKVSSHINILYFQKDEIIFEQEQKPQEVFFVLREGVVELYEDFRNEKILFDICDEGDIFGVRPLFNINQGYTLTAYVSEEALVYAVSAAEFNAIAKNNPDVNNYFSTSFISGKRRPFVNLKKHKTATGKENNLTFESSLHEIQSFRQRKNLVTCTPDVKIKDAAKIMKEKSVGSIIIIDDQMHPTGIFTDRDLRNKVATGEISNDEPVLRIMSSPVITTSPEITISDLQIEMIKNNIHHLCITEDGTNNSRITGIVSEHDILLSHANDPSVLIREISRAENAHQLKSIRLKSEQLLNNYLEQEISIAYVCGIITEINNALTARSIQLAIEDLGKECKYLPEVDWCWLATGSLGREEQLLRTDQDNALVFDNVNEERYKEVKNYFLELASKVNSSLKDIGFEFCPAEMMAKNPDWCLSLEEWNKQFEDWIFNPGNNQVMFSTIFFDFRPLYGNSELAGRMREGIYKSVSHQKSFLSFLAKNAIENPPPLSFFRNFMVENNGEHKDEFDIKGRAMMPLVDAARVLILDAKLLDKQSTIRRYLHLAELEPVNKNLFEELAEVFEILLRIKTLQGLKHNNSGRYFHPEELNKIERLLLKNSFRTIKEIQTLLTVRYNLNLFR